MAWLLTRGTRTSARVETVLTIVKIAIVLLVIVVGFTKVKTGNLQPFAPFGLGGRSPERRRSSSPSSVTTR